MFPDTCRVQRIRQYLQSRIEIADGKHRLQQLEGVLWGKRQATG